jgi:hypothetical protein
VATIEAADGVMGAAAGGIAAVGSGKSRVGKNVKVVDGDHFIVA